MIRKVKNEILDPENDEFKLACSKILKTAEERMRNRLQQQNSENLVLQDNYQKLENEFRDALKSEDEKFKTLDEKYQTLLVQHEKIKTQNSEHEKKIEIQAEKLKDSVLNFKEVKTKLESIQKGNLEKDEIWKNRVDSLEKELSVQRKLAAQLEPLKIEKSRLLSRITAHESVMDGLKLERKKWTEELTTKGFELSNERGRLEAKISSQKEEIDRLQKQVNESNDIIRVKSVLIDDTSKTVRELKDKLREKETKEFDMEENANLKSEIRRLRLGLVFGEMQLAEYVANFPAPIFPKTKTAFFRHPKRRAQI